MLEEKPTGQHSNGMEGVIEEGKDALEKEEEGASFDSGLIGAALRTEHYEIAGYEACIAMASTLGLAKVVRLLAADLKEELATAKKITAAGGPILKQSAKEPEAPKKPKSGKEQKSAKKMRRRPIRNCPSKALPSEGYLSIKVGSRFSDVVTAHHLSVEQRAEPFVVKVAEVSRKQRGGTQAAVVRAADPPFRYRLAVEHGLVTDVKTGSGSLQRPSLQHHTAGQLRSTVNLNRAFW